MGAGFLAKVGLAIVARTMPQMNVFIVGLPIQIAIGLLAMAVSLPFFVKVLHLMFASMSENMWTIFR
jgi:flagellar biosynthetic protein FliR